MISNGCEREHPRVSGARNGHRFRAGHGLAMPMDWTRWFWPHLVYDRVSWDSRVGDVFGEGSHCTVTLHPS